ncbi:MAG: YdcF family protein [Oscillospiraceae bacterium]|nr:YdcF family protein [Oscillospiraceae bacterium]
MLNYKKRGFSGFSLMKKIAVLLIFLMLVFMICLAFLSTIRGAGAGNIGVWFPVVYFLIMFIVTYNLDELKKILKKLYNPLIIVFYSGMIFFLTAFAVFCIMIFGYSSDTIPENPDLIIVLGCQVRGNNPSVLLKSRLDQAVETLIKYPDAICIVSGGQGPDEIIQESRVMKKYLADKGIDENRIFEEDESSSSFENLVFSKKVIEENNIKHENIIIITSEYHVPRAVLIAKRVYPGINIYAVKSKTQYAFFTAGIVREFFAFVKSYIFDKT